MSRPRPEPESEAQPGMATGDLRREHEIILRALTLLERAGRRLVAGRSVDETAMKDLIGLLRTLADQCHHGKEEGYPFPSMREKGVPPDGPIGLMLAAHAEGRDYLGTLAGLPSRAERAAAALLYVQVMREHIDKENNLIFPAADRLFTPEEQAMLAQVLSGDGGAQIGPERIVPPPPAGDRRAGRDEHHHRGAARPGAGAPETDGPPARRHPPSGFNALCSVANLHVACSVRNCRYFELMIPSELFDLGLAER